MLKANPACSGIGCGVINCVRREGEKAVKYFCLRGRIGCCAGSGRRAGCQTGRLSTFDLLAAVGVLSSRPIDLTEQQDSMVGEGVTASQDASVQDVRSMIKEIVLVAVSDRVDVRSELKELDEQTPKGLLFFEVFEQMSDVVIDEFNQI